MVYNIPVTPYYQLCIYFRISRLVLRLDTSVIIYDSTYSKFFGISQSPAVLFSPSVPIYVYIGFCTKGHTNYCVGSGIFDTGHIAMFILLLSFPAPLLLWAFQKQMGFGFPFLNRFMYSRINVL